MIEGLPSKFQTLKGHWNFHLALASRAHLGLPRPPPAGLQLLQPASGRQLRVITIGCWTLKLLKAKALFIHLCTSSFSLAWSLRNVDGTAPTRHVSKENTLFCFSEAVLYPHTQKSKCDI